MVVLLATPCAVSKDAFRGAISSSVASLGGNDTTPTAERQRRNGNGGTAMAERQRINAKVQRRKGPQMHGNSTNTALRPLQLQNIRAAVAADHHIAPGV